MYGFMNFIYPFLFDVFSLNFVFLLFRSALILFVYCSVFLLQIIIMPKNVFRILIPSNLNLNIEHFKKTYFHFKINLFFMNFTNKLLFLKANLQSNIYTTELSTTFNQSQKLKIIYNIHN